MDVTNQMKQPTIRYGLRLGPCLTLDDGLAVQALSVAWYNFSQKLEALKGKAPAMTSGPTDQVWTAKELIERATEA